MKQFNTEAIVLSRIDYGEADRIISVLTPNSGKIRLMARGVRKVKSKLAGGIELFSISELSYITGRGEMGTLISSRLKKHFGGIIQDINRVQLGYELIKMLNRATEEHTEPAYFDLLANTLKALEDINIDLELIRCWFEAQILKIAGHTPNLTNDTIGKKLDSKNRYNLNIDAMTFTEHKDGHFNADQIKVLRLLFSSQNPESINLINDLSDYLPHTAKLIDLMFGAYIRR